MWWCPTHCNLQLQFPAPPPGSTALFPGTAYKGISSIRYRKTSIDAHQATSGHSGLTSSSALTLVGRTGMGLHLHAYTENPQPQRGGPNNSHSNATGRPQPMEIHKYRLTCRYSGEGGAVRRGEVLKISSVVEESVSAAASNAEESRKATGRVKKGGKKTAAVPANTTAEVEVGSRWIQFDGDEQLGDGAQVELVVPFTAYIQEAAHGGLFTPSRVVQGNPGVLATHFEVRLARLAFPCSDHPAYRLLWTLQALQLPDVYTQVFTNSPCVRQTAMPHQHAVQYSFQPCGPMPAYLFAIAAFAEEISSLEQRVPYPAAPLQQYLSATLDGSSHDEQGSLLVRVVSAVPCALDWVLRVVVDALELLQHFFMCPIPLLQDTADEIQLTVLIGPTAPYISGMEHHCFICLNESLFYTAPGKKAAAKSESEKELERAMLIVHELAHHWMGNAVGLPFALKEGICQVLEHQLTPKLLGRSQKALVPGEAREVLDPEGGKEFTLLTYMHALQALNHIAATKGLAHLQCGLRRLVREHVLKPMISAAEEMTQLYVVCDTISGTSWPDAPYFTTEVVMDLLTGD